MYEEWILGDRTTLKANPTYWGGEPAIETLNYKVILDESVRTIAMETGNVQIVLDIGAAADNLKVQENVTLVNFKHIGVELEIKILEWGTYLETLAQGEHQLFLLGWSNASFDPDSSLHFIFHTDGANNNAFYSNPEFDALVNKAAIELDPKVRAKYYEDVQRILRNDRATFFLYARDYTLAFKKGLVGVLVIPTGDHRLNKLEYK